MLNGQVGGGGGERKVGWLVRRLSSVDANSTPKKHLHLLHHRAQLTKERLRQEARGSRARLQELREQEEEAEEEQVAPSPPPGAEESTRLRRQLLLVHNELKVDQNREFTRRYTLQR